MIILTEYVFAKLQWFRKNCNEKNLFNSNYDGFLEVSLLGVSQDENHLNTIVDLHCIEQECSSGLTEPTDQGVLNYLEGQVLDHGIQPPVTGRFWAHTHPGKSAEPSSTDNDTFKKWYEHCNDWGVMYILAEGQDTCTVQYDAGLVFKHRRERMPVFVLMDKKDPSGKPVYLRTSSIFELDELSTKAIGQPIAHMIFSDYSDYHESWMEEMKACVKKKSWQQYNHYNSNASQSHSQKKTQTHTGTQSQIANTSAMTCTNKGSHGSVNATPSPFTCFQLVHMLVRNKAETPNALGHQGLQEMAKHFGCTHGDIMTAWGTVKMLQDRVKPSEIAIYEKDLISIDGSPVPLNSLPENKLIDICRGLVVLPSKLKELVALYIDQCKGI